ncbi:unnamed protein product, partial [Lymnaea stagnalis]
RPLTTEGANGTALLEGPNGTTLLTRRDLSGDEDSDDVTGPFASAIVPTDTPEAVHRLGILRMTLNPSEEDARLIVQLVEDENISFSVEFLEDYSSDDVYSFRKVYKDLREKKPTAVIGPYSWPYAVAAEHARIPYFVTSLTPTEQPLSSYIIQLFPDPSVYAQATEDMLRYYGLNRVVVFHDSPAGAVVLERLAQKSWMLVTGVLVNNKTLPLLREKLKVVRSKYFTTFTAVLSSSINPCPIPLQALSLSMFSTPHKWLLVNLGLREYDLDKFVDSHANVTVLRLMMDYNSKFCALDKDFINLRRAVFHDAIRLYDQMYGNRSETEKVNMRQTVRKLEMDGCTGHLMFSSFGKRTESFLQLMTLEGYQNGSAAAESEVVSRIPTVWEWEADDAQYRSAQKIRWCDHSTSGTWRSKPDEVKQRVEPSKSYSLVSQISGNVFGDDPLRITVILEEPFVMEKTDKSLDTGHPVYEGFCIDILIEMAKVLGFQYNISKVPDGKFGSKKLGGWTGMIRQLIDKKADVALAPFQMATERAEVVDFTKPYMTKGTTVVVKRPDQGIGVFQFLAPLSNIVWSAIFVAFIGTSLMLFAVSRVNSDRQAKYTHNLRESFWYIWGTLLRGSLSGSPHAISSRIVSSAWWFFCLILSSIYTANLAAFLTITNGDVGINTASDLATQNIFDYGTVEGSQTEMFFRHTKMRHYETMWAYMSSLSPKSMSRTTDIGFE